MRKMCSSYYLTITSYETVIPPHSWHWCFESSIYETVTAHAIKGTRYFRIQRAESIYILIFFKKWLLGLWFPGSWHQVLLWVDSCVMEENNASILGKESIQLYTQVTSEERWGWVWANRNCEHENDPEEGKLLLHFCFQRQYCCHVKGHFTVHCSYWPTPGSISSPFPADLSDHFLSNLLTQHKDSSPYT